MDKSGEQILLCERCQHSAELPSLRPIDPLILHSSHVPSEIESTQTLETLEEEMQRLQRYEDPISYLYQIFERMEASKRELEAHIKRRRSIISIQRRVPTKIWEAIFAFTCSSSFTRGYSLTIGRFSDLTGNVVRTQVPVILSHVCHRWRAIVTSFPRLWSSISINLHGPISHGHKTLVETFLAKSEGHPLDLDVGASTLTLSEENGTIWETLKRHFSRCGRLDLSVYEFNLLAPPLGSRYSFPHLLSFRGWNEGGVHDQQFWKALCQAPKLTKMDLNTLPIRYPVPYTQLTTLIIYYIDHSCFPELFEVLEASKNLSSLSLRIDTERKGTLVHVARRVEMLFLRTFSLDLCTVSPPKMDDPNLNVLFSSLVMPVLTHFKFAGEQTISRSRNGTVMWSPLLLTMLRHSSSTLRRMTFHFHPLDQDYWQDFSVLFEIAPHLTHLDLWGGWRTEGLTLISSSIGKLTTDGMQNILLPDLQHIGIDVQHSDDIHTTRVLDLATSRSFSRLSPENGVKPLKELCIYTQPEFRFGLYVLEKIKRLERGGLRVEVVSIEP